MEEDFLPCKYGFLYCNADLSAALLRLCRGFSTSRQICNANDHTVYVLCGQGISENTKLAETFKAASERCHCHVYSVADSQRLIYDLQGIAAALSGEWIGAGGSYEELKRIPIHS